MNTVLNDPLVGSKSARARTRKRLGQTDPKTLSVFTSRDMSATAESCEGRHKAFNTWLDGIEWMQGRHLGRFRADEMFRFSGLGFPEIPEHQNPPDH